MTGCTDTPANSSGMLGQGFAGTAPSVPVAGESGAGADAMAGMSAGEAGAGVGGMLPAAGASGGSQATPDAGAGQAGGGGEGGAADASMPAPDADAPPLEIPEPTATAFVWGVGIGVTDMPGAVSFFTSVLDLTIEQQDVVREDRSETVLYPTGAGRGSRLVLMKYNDNRDTRLITAKLVWQAPSPSAINRAASSHPDYVSRLNFGIVQFDGPETYVQEVGRSFDSGGSGIVDPYLVAMGFSVSNLTRTIDFYTSAFGVNESRLGTFTVTDATGRGSITEHTLQMPGGNGSALVIQSWSPMRNSMNNPVKIVLFVPDAQASADAVLAAGGSIVQQAARTPVYDNRLLVVAKDPDGYLLELVQ